jgi:hypothetical protein
MCFRGKRVESRFACSVFVSIQRHFSDALSANCGVLHMIIGSTASASSSMVLMLFLLLFVVVDMLSSVTAGVIEKMGERISSLFMFSTTKNVRSRRCAGGEKRIVRTRSPKKAASMSPIMRSWVHLVLILMLHTRLWLFCSSECAVKPVNGHVTIPSTWTNISRSAFYGCTSLKSVEIGGNIKIINEYAFSGCPNLYTVDMKSGVEFIGNSSFKDAIGLSSISFPDTLTEIGSFAFDGCLLLQSVTIGGNIQKVGPLAFSGCKSMTEASVGDSVVQLGSSAFLFCDQLQTIYIGSGLTTISSGLFYGCSKLKKVTLSSLSILENISNDAFIRCQSLEEINLPSTVIYIGPKAFYKCGSLKEIFIGDAVKEIGTNAFAGCERLTRLAFGKSLTTIHASAFERTYSLSNVTFSGDGALEVIGDSAFRLSAPTSITFPKNLKYIGLYAFAYNPSLESLVFRSSNITFGTGPFSECNKLKAKNVWYTTSMVRFESSSSSTAGSVGDAFQNLVCDSSSGCFCAATTGTSLDSDNYFNCLPCPVGKYSNQSIGTRACEDCGKGTYNAASGQSECILCPSGSACSVDGMSAYEYCEKGTYSIGEGSTVCIYCLPGMYQPDMGMTSCLPCRSGTSAPSFGLSECVDCENGTFSDHSGSEQCMDCPVDFYTNSSMENKILCISCPPGYTTDGKIGSSKCALDMSSCSRGMGRNKISNICEKCPRGKYSTYGSRTTCDECARGYYSNELGATSCSSCPPGKYSSAQGAVQCSQCPPGSFCSGAGRANPLPCPAGTFSNSSEATDCTACAASTFQNVTGSVMCSSCPRGMPSNSNRTDCLRPLTDNGGNSGESSSSQEDDTASQVLSGGAAIYGSFLIAFVFVAAAGYMQHLRKQLMNRLGDLSDLKMVVKSLLSGFIFASEWFLIAVMWQYKKSFAGTMLFFRLLCNGGGTVFLLYCMSDVHFKKAKKYVEILIPSRGAFTADTNPLFEEVNHGFLEQNKPLCYTIMFLSFLEIPMVQFLPWIKSKVFKKCGGFPTLAAYHFVFCTSAAQRMMSVVCQIAFLGGDEHNDGKADSGQAKALFGLCIFCSLFEVLLMGGVLLTKHRALEVLDAEASDRLTKARKSVRASRVSLTSIYANTSLEDGDEMRLSKGDVALHQENPMHGLRPVQPPRRGSLNDNIPEAWSNDLEDNEAERGNESNHKSPSSPQPSPPAEEEVEESRGSLQNVPL